MNLHELLEDSFPGGDVEVPEHQWATPGDPGQVIAAAGWSKGRVLIWLPQPEVVTTFTERTTMVPVARVMNVCTDPGFRRQGYARRALESVHAAIAGTLLTSFAALFAGEDEAGFLFEPLGYFHPEQSPPEFLVCPVRAGAEWPAGRVDLRDRW